MTGEVEGGRDGKLRGGARGAGARRDGAADGARDGEGAVRVPGRRGARPGRGGRDTGPRRGDGGAGSGRDGAATSGSGRPDATDASTAARAVAATRTGTVGGARGDATPTTRGMPKTQKSKFKIK